MEKINIAELLKDCPKGMELYSPLCGKCIFDRLNFGTIICKKQNTEEITFTHEGYYMLPVFDNCECMIFPSKDQRDWSKFQRHFKDGDVITCTNSVCSFVAIFKEMYTNTTFRHYVSLTLDNEPQFVAKENWADFINPRFATEEEKQKLFDAIKTNGYKWNTETKTLERLIVPKFKVGDRIRHKYANKDHIYEISKVYDDSYGLVDFIWMVYMKYQDDYELVPNKFDITTLKPFDKVLARQDNRVWECDFFSSYDSDERDFDKFHCVGGWYKECIPYKGNEHLLGKTDDCSDYFKTWE